MPIDLRPIKAGLRTEVLTRRDALADQEVAERSSVITETLLRVAHLHRRVDDFELLFLQ